MGERYTSSQVGGGLTLVPLVGINDGNGGANYAVTLVDNSDGRPSALDLAGLGASNFASRLNGDTGTNISRSDGSNARTRSSELATNALEPCHPSSDSGGSADERGASDHTRGHCATTAEQSALIHIVSSGIRLPPRLETGEGRRDTSSLRHGAKRVAQIMIEYGRKQIFAAVEPEVSEQLTSAHYV